jgi:hypothetical protein
VRRRFWRMTMWRRMMLRRMLLKRLCRWWFFERWVSFLEDFEMEK